MRTLSVIAAGAAASVAAAFHHGVTGIQDPAHAKAKGANSIKTYDEWQLGQVDCSLGLDVFAGIPVDPHAPPDLAASAAVDFVNRNKDRPCIKLWGIGNELDMKGDPDTMMRLASAVSTAVKGADPSRKTSSCLGGYDRLPNYLSVGAPSSIDILCVNCYGCAESTCDKVAASGYKGDYILGEYGVHGWWEEPKLPGTTVALEPSSTEKAVQTAVGYEGGVSKCEGTGVNVIGAYAFTNERKIEGSATWFGLWATSPDVAGGALQPVSDRWAVLQSIWAGNPPKPADVPALLAGQGIATVDKVSVTNGGYVGPGADFTASVGITSTDPGLVGKYDVKWEVRPDITPGAPGGSSGATMQTNEPGVVASASSSTSSDGGNLRGSSGSGSGSEAGLKAPAVPGAYRVTAFLVPKDGSGGVLTSSAPLVVG